MATRNAKGAQALTIRLPALFCAGNVASRRLCAGDRKVCQVPFAPVRQPAHSCHPFVWRRFVAAPKQKEL
ncbi:hypothetical protein D6Z43_15000 [Pseudomonas sp. DY-1]|nr:hypothetical protein D6Z43_15000 [Pseudomonas sp. DY-1]MDH4654366.1 hypothetical protein [Pseudomonas sp. BN606]MRK23597.1 hypothetical protein [Pseudomonas sp. JG-B]